jgi:DNA-binding NarL/FixJ family response regulator
MRVFHRTAVSVQLPPLVLTAVEVAALNSALNTKRLNSLGFTIGECGEVLQRDRVIMERGFVSGYEKLLKFAFAQLEQRTPSKSRETISSETPAMLGVLIAGYHAILRLGLKNIITDAFDSVVFGVAADAMETLELLGSGSWDILILDVHLPGLSSFEILKKVHQVAPKLPVLVLSSMPEDQLGLQVIRAGAAGYINREKAAELLVVAILELQAGRQFISPQLRARLANDRKRRSQYAGLQALSIRELQVVQMLAAGRSVKQIAAELDRSVKTISTFRRRVFDKLGITNDIDLLRCAQECGFLPKP